MNKLHHKDFTIAFKTGSDANKSKFKKEAVQGEMYFATDSRKLYVAEVTAGVSDATLAQFNLDIQNTYAVSYDGFDDYHEVSLDGTSTGGVLASSDADIELTISFWFKPSGGNIFAWMNNPTSISPTIWLTPQNASGTNYKLFYDASYRHTFSSSEIVVGSWNHFMMTRTASNNTWSVFCNGNSTPVHTYVQSGTLSYRANMTGMYFSKGYYGLGQNVFDEIAFWNSDQSSNLSSIYGSSTAGSGSPTDLGGLNPYGWWRMGDNETTASNGSAAGTITNIGSTANDMTVGGGSPTYTTSVV